MASYGFESTIEASKLLIKNRRDLSSPNLTLDCDRLASSHPFSSENVTEVDLNQYDIFLKDENPISVVVL